MPQDTDPSDDTPWPLDGSGYGHTAPAVSPSLSDNLAKAIDFSPDMLAANRDGQLADGQISDLHDAISGTVWQTFIQIGLWVVIVGFGAVGVGRTRAGHPIGPITDPYLLALLLLALVVGIVVMLLPAGLKWADIRSRRVMMIEGEVTRQIYKDGAHFFVKGRGFKVPALAYDALEAGRRYRVYYTPYSRTLLSIEPV